MWQGRPARRGGSGRLRGLVSGRVRGQVSGAVVARGRHAHHGGVLVEGGVGAVVAIAAGGGHSQLVLKFVEAGTAFTHGAGDIAV